jgi:hypothetical protein
MMSKPIDDFERYKGNNRRKSCKPCHRQETKDRVKAMQEENPLSSKICGKCGVEKVLADFPVSPTHKGGRHTYCRECNTKYAHDKQDRKMAEERESLAILYASMDPSARPLPKSCGNPQCCFGTGEQPPENFKISKIHKSGLRIYCRICQTQRKREFEAINRSEDKTANGLRNTIANGIRSTKMSYISKSRSGGTLIQRNVGDYILNGDSAITALLRNGMTKLLPRKVEDVQSADQLILKTNGTHL